MCPLRIILVFLSATLAGYFAWKTVRSAGTSPLDDYREEAPRTDGAEKNRNRDLRKVIGDGFWIFVDMASGRYLWRNLGGAKER